MTERITCLTLMGLLVSGCADLSVEIPEYQPPGEPVWLEQGWSPDERFRYYHLDQGTRTLPYQWFLALEQPCWSPFGCDPFADSTYLARFGFLESAAHPRNNPDGLPVGFARNEEFTDPETGEQYPVVGFNCAACHTGELYWEEYAVRIEGGPALIELAQFQKALGLAMFFTQKYPFRYGRFEERVLGPDASEADRLGLQLRFDKFLEAGAARKAVADERKLYENRAGFMRTDALNRIGNEVFGFYMKNDDNLAVANAAVRFPQLWDASWLTWVQYNSSIADPLVRNIGEALGVRAAAKLYGEDALEFKNSVNVPGLKALEELLAGSGPFEGLRSPEWPDVFPGLDRERVARGAELYAQHCQACHLPPIDELKADLAAEEPRYWRENRLGRRLLAVKDIKIDFIGTDPLQARDFVAREADISNLGGGRVPASEGLAFITKGIAAKAFRDLGLSPEERMEWSGYRDPEDPAVRAEAIYRARPLNGIWAVAPYLHNGSVPNLYALLSPEDERPDSFWLGSRQFDPINVGYDTAEIKGGYLFDVSKAGNSNKGHEFRDAAVGDGVIGPFLPPEDRWSLVEYLKSL